MVKETCEGHQCKVENVLSGTSYARCNVCNQKVSLKVPTKFAPDWNLTGFDEDIVNFESLSDLGSDPIKVNIGDKIYFTLDVLEVDVAISDENRLSYTRDAETDGHFTALANGNVKVSMNPKWNPDLKVIFKVKVGNAPEAPSNYEMQIENVQKSRTSVTKLVAGKKKITVKFRKVEITDIKYQVAVKEAGTDKWNKYNTGSTSMTIKKLLPKKVYYVKVRPYKRVGESVYYGKWSTTKSVRIK